MPNRAVSVLDFVTAVQASVAQDFGKESGDPNALVVQHIELKLKTVLSEKAGGGFEWRLLTATGEAIDTQTQTLSLCWERRPLNTLAATESLPADLPYQLIAGMNALRIGAAEWTRLSPDLPFQSVGGQLVFAVAVRQDGSLYIGKFGGGAGQERMHTVTLKLAPLT
ncbi:trypco2 family protein [Deinococcus frigens]|uniref:trypco2 family protein n=1 Tax=Deinococcus frigens TaxID=249403 RepID=UPI0004959120|nr:trypco2 family protein [Deinococcus frigens]